MVFHWSLNDSKSSQISGTLNILADLNNVVVLMVSTRPLISQSSCPFDNHSVTEPRAPITIGINVTFMFHSFFQFPSKVKVFVLLFIFFQFYSIVSGIAKSTNFQVLFFCWLLIGLVVWPRLDDSFVGQNAIEVYVCHSPGETLDCAHTICSYGQI